MICTEKNQRSLFIFVGIFILSYIREDWRAKVIVEPQEKLYLLLATEDGVKKEKERQFLILPVILVSMPLVPLGSTLGSCY